MRRIGITMTGYPGSGSTTLANGVARALGWHAPYYAGGIVRWLIGEIDKKGLAEIQKMSATEIADAFRAGANSPRLDIARRYASFLPELDRLVDGVQQEFIEHEERGVHEGRIAWFFARRLRYRGRAADKGFFHICCTVDPRVGAERVWGRDENPGCGATVSQIFEESAARLATERERYRGLYGIGDHLDPANFDLLIDTTARTKEEALIHACDAMLRRFPWLCFS